MKRRTVLAGLGTAAAGSAVAFSTGAFTNLSADRSLTVDVAADSNAALTIQENDNTSPHPTSDPAVASSAATANVTTSDYVAYAGGTAFPVEPLTDLNPYAGDSAQLVSETSGEITLDLGNYQYADGVNQGVVVFEDLIRVQNNSGTALNVSASKTGDTTSNLDILTTDPAASGDPTDGDGQTVSLLSNTVRQSFAGSWGGITLFLNPSGTITGENITISLEATPAP